MENGVEISLMGHFSPLGCSTYQEAPPVCVAVEGEKLHPLCDGDPLSK